MSGSEHDATGVARRLAPRLAQVTDRLEASRNALPAIVDRLAPAHVEEYAATLLWVADHLDRLALLTLAALAQPNPDPVPCGNVHGCPDEGEADKAGRCSACYQYQRRTGRDRRVAG